MAYTIGAYVRVQGETEFSAKMKQLKADMGYAKSEADALTSAYGKNSSGVGSLTAKASGLKSAMKIQTQAVEAAEDALKQMEADGVDPASEGYKKMEQNLNNAKTALNKTESELGDVEEALKDAKESTNDFGDAFDKIAPNVSSAVKNIISGGQEASAAMSSGSWAGVVSGAATCVSGIAAIGQAAIEAAKGIWELEAEVAGNADDILTESTKLGIDSTTYQKWEYAAKFVDVELSTIKTAYAKMPSVLKSAEDGIVSFVDGTGEAFGSVNLNGITDTTDAFYACIDAIGALGDSTQQDLAAQQLFGRSFMELKPLIDAGTEAWKEYGEYAEEQGYIMTEDEVAKMGELNDRLDELDAKTQAAKNSITQVLLPAMESMVDVVSAAADAVTSLAEALENISAKNYTVTLNTQVTGDVAGNEFAANMAMYTGGLG